ncbi:MAG: WxL domain-containing protein [Acidimicrobiia bacterium]|nr:WxL domain-containing protein [Actinomycetota bacterium]MBL6925353.1 WxL domain-containing protein [Acidimicrobiia bacterium]
MGAESTSVTITGATPASTTPVITFDTVTLSGSDTTTTGSATWSVADPRGTGAGWNVTVVSTDFIGTIDGVVKTIDIDAGNQDLLVSIASIAISAGNAAPTTTITSDTDVPFSGATPLKILSAAVDAGMGSYTYVPTFTLEIPTSTVAGTYAAAVTVTINAGP